MRGKSPKMAQKTLFSSSLGKDNIIDNIAQAGKEKKTVNITYVDSKGNVSSRETEPYEIKGDKYFGYCLEKNSIRGFNLGNIQSASPTKNSFSPRWEVKF